MAYNKLLLFSSCLLLLATLFSSSVFAFLLDSRAIKNGTIAVDANNTLLSFTDSGPPKASPYTTVFLVHGMSFNAGIFSKVQALAGPAGLRLVAINRRDYIGSTPYSNAELDVVNNGTVAQRDDFMKARGIELGIFMDKFMQQNNIPALSADGRAGGAAVIGWSVGNIFTLSTIANIHALPEDVQARLASRIHTLVMQEPSAEILGLPSNPNNWIPLIDTSIPADTRIPATAQWVTSYFRHGDLSTRDPDVLSWVVPSIVQPPSIFNMSFSQFDDIVDLGAGSSTDYSLLINFSTQLHTNYRGAIFNATIKASMPKMKNWHIAGERSVAFGPYGLFLVEGDNDAAGGGFINFKTISGVNHFIQWDNPETTITVYSQIILG